MGWQRILACFFRHTAAEPEWYRLLAACFQPTKTALRWIVTDNRLEMHWQMQSREYDE